MKKILSMVILVLSISFLSVASYGQIQRKELKFQPKVRLQVSASGNIEALIKSYLARELRSIGGVTVVDDKADWLISVAAIETHSQAGQRIGVALSIVVLRPFDNTVLKSTLENLKPQDINYIDLFTTSLYGLEGQWINVGATEDLKRICEKIIANFDTEHLEKQRQAFQQFNKALKEQNQK